MNKLIKILYGTGFVITTILAIVVFSSFTIEDSVMTTLCKIIILIVLIAGAMFNFIQGFPNFFIDEDYIEDDVDVLLKAYRERINDLEEENINLLGTLSRIPKMLNTETKQEIEAFITSELLILYGFKDKKDDKENGKGDGSEK